MDRNSIIVIVACAVALVLWVTVVAPKFAPRPQPVAAGNVITNGTVQGTLTNTDQVHGQLTEAVQTAATMLRPIFATNVPEQELVVSNEDARYTFTSYGGGLKLVELLHYPETVAKKKDGHETNHFAKLNANTPAPTLAVIGGGALQDDGIFSITRTATGVRAEKALTNGLTLVKDFSLASNYLVNAEMRFENRSSNSLALPAQEWIVGTATPMSARDDGSRVGMMWFNGDKTVDINGASYFSSRGFMCSTRIPPTEFRGGASNVVWAAVHNQYFVLAVMPPQPANEVIVRRLELPRATGEDAALVATNAAPPQGYETVLTYPAITLAPNQSTNRHVVLYAGPKEYKTLSRVAAQFNNKLDSLMNFGWTSFVAAPLLLGMNLLHNTLSLSYAWAIIFITVIIKLLFWPLTQASTRSMKRMSALQPQIKAIQEKYKEDPMKAQQKVMEFYKQNKINPLGGCLPMVIQMPVFIGFFSMMQTAIELRGVSFLWIADLSRPDTLFVIPGLSFIPIIGIPGVGLPFNLLPLLMGASMLWQSHLAPASPGVDPAQQRMMRWMPAMFIVFFYNYSSGLALYWTVSNLLTIVQTKLTKTEPAPALTPALKKSK
jgi:YidC/Oxa1 family membrane protein insertase